MGWTVWPSSDLDLPLPMPKLFKPRPFSIVLILFLIAGLSSFYWLMRDNGTINVAPKSLKMATLRQLAGSVPGQSPDIISRELIASREFSSDFAAAGTGLRLLTSGTYAYRLNVPGGAPIMIDTGMTARQAQDAKMSFHDAAAQLRVEKALEEARLILSVSELPEHMGGLVTLARRPGVLDKVWLNPAQIPPSPRAAELDWPSELFISARLGTTAPEAVAHGVVVIPAPGASPGSQMIFVRLARGHEYLFTGDVAQFTENWAQVRTRSRLATYMSPAQDRAEVLSWLQTINALKREAPSLIIVPGHEARALLNRAGHPAILQGFDY